MKKNPKVTPNDPLRLDLQLSKEETAIQLEARNYAETKLRPRVQEAFREEHFDTEILREMGKHRFLGLNFNGYGCRGVNHVAYGLVAFELEKIDSGYRTIFSVQSSLAMQAIYAHGSDEQKEKYLPGMVKGEKVGCFGLTEPLHGSDPGGMETRATKVDGGYKLNGHKKWIGLAVLADVLIVWAKDDEDIVRGFILDKGMDGVATNYIEGKYSMRTAPTCEIRMKDVFVPDSQCLPEAKGLSGPFVCLNKARFSIAWGALGAAYACWQIVKDYTIERMQFGRPLAANQLIQVKLADMQTEIALALQGALRVSRLLDEGQCSNEAISLVKRCCAEKALNIALVARDILGANGITDEYPVIRHLMNLIAVNTYEGTKDIHALILGRAQTGIAAFVN